MTTSNLGFLALVLATLSTYAAPARANILLNHSFESPAVPTNPGYLQYFGGSNAISGWTVIGDNILLLHTTYSELGPPYFTGVAYNAHDGLTSVDLTGGGGTNSLTNDIAQTVATTTGLLYELQFYVGRAQSNNGDPRAQTPVTVDLSINGSPRVGYTNSDAVLPGFVGWKQFTKTFVATGPSTTITFLSATPAVPAGANYLGLDKVSLSTIYELPGDYNRDGSVDTADYVVWRKNIGPMPNDATPGIGPDDYGRWRTHFGESNENAASLSTPFQATVPEPTSIALLAIATAISLLVRGAAFYEANTCSHSEHSRTT